MRYIDSVEHNPGEWRIRGINLSNPAHYIDVVVDITGCSGVSEQDAALAMGEATCKFLRFIGDSSRRAEAGRLICGGIAKVIAEATK